MSHRDKIVPETAASVASTRLRLGEFFADIFADARGSSSSRPASTTPAEELFHWVIQRKGSTEIIHAGQDRGFEEARQAALACLTRLAGRDQRASNL